jgi:excinuclease ABC subunit B
MASTSALDDRLVFEEFEACKSSHLCLPHANTNWKRGRVAADGVIRPTGLLDPMVTVKPLATQVDDLLEQVRTRVKRGERVLVTTLTKRMSEDLTDYLNKVGVRVRYLHSEVHAIERTELIRDLRLHNFDGWALICCARVSVAEVSCGDLGIRKVLRSERSLIQTAGRAARNQNGKLFSHDKITDRCKAIDDRRRAARRITSSTGLTPRLCSRPVKKYSSRLSLPTAALLRCRLLKNPGTSN